MSWCPFEIAPNVWQLWLWVGSKGCHFGHWRYDFVKINSFLLSKERPIYIWECWNLLYTPEERPIFVEWPIEKGVKEPIPILVYRCHLRSDNKLDCIVIFEYFITFYPKFWWSLTFKWHIYIVPPPCPQIGSWLDSIFFP